MTIIKNALAITSLDDWEQRAGPKADYHWADGRSAKEAAKAWFGIDGSTLPVEVQTAQQRPVGGGR